MSRTIELRLPFAKRGTALTLTTDTSRQMVKAIADAIAQYAARQGVSPRAVQYDFLAS